MKEFTKKLGWLVFAAVMLLLGFIPIMLGFVLAFIIGGTKTGFEQYDIFIDWINKRHRKLVNEHRGQKNGRNNITGTYKV